MAYDIATGAKRWGATFGPASDTFAVRIVDGVATGVVGTGPTPNDIQAFDVATGQQLWTMPATPLQSPEPADHNIFVGQADGTVAALDPATGHVRWSLPLPNGPLAAGPGLVLAPGDDGLHVTGVEPTSGRARWSAAITSPPFPVNDAPTPNGFSVAGNGVLPTGAGVFFGIGNCLGS